MLKDAEARVPFAVIGVLLVVVTTIATAYLIGMEALGVSRGISDDRERDFGRALTLAAADIGSALNYAGLSAEAAAGKEPVINVSDSGPFSKGDAEEGRIKYLAWRQLAKYLEANYNGSFTCGDYCVSAALPGDYRSIAISPGDMTLYRKFDHPLAGCNGDYTAYYTMSVPVLLTVRKPGGGFEYSEERVIRSLIAARYPLLKALVREHELRLNGTPLWLDLTAASFAYTWARGYAQYATGSPLNIVDNAHVELIANGAALMEQGFVYNSVDPMSLATLAYKCLGNAARPSEVNRYDVGNNSEEGLPRGNTTPPSDRYSFNVEQVVDRAYDNVSFGGYTEYTLDGAYTARMRVRITRERDCFPRTNSTYVAEDEIWHGPPSSPGEWPLLTRVFRVYQDNSDGTGFADRVSVTYVVTLYSALQYFGAGRFADSSERMDDPALAGSSDDVAGPFGSFAYEKCLSFGNKAFTDDNLREAVRWYQASFDRYRGQGYFERTLEEIISDREGWQGRVPAAFTDGSREFVCGPENNHPIWAEIEADYELRDLCAALKKEVVVNLKPETCGDSPGAMTSMAYKMLDALFRDGYDRYLDRGSYLCASPPGGYCNLPAYRSCGAKAIFRIRHAFLEDVRRQLDEAAGRAGDAVNGTIDGRMKDTGMNASTLTAAAASAKGYLEEHLYIPFGLAMGLNSSPEFACGYPWREGVMLAIHQSPPYLDAGQHVDEETGYTARMLRLRNVCLFSLSADVEWTDEIADAIADRVVAGIDAIAASAEEIANQTVTAEISSLSSGMARGLEGQLKGEIAASCGNDAATRGYAERAVDRAYERRGDDADTIIRDLCDGTLAREIAVEIVSESAAGVRDRAREIAAGYADEYAAYVARTIEKKVAAAQHKAIAKVTAGFRKEIRDAFRDFAREAAQEIAARGANAALQKALGMVPSGLPLLPPWGWWATLNAWYIEVQGEIPVLTVFDADAEPVPDPVFGGQAIAYTRRHQAVHDDQGRFLGMNVPIRFRQTTGTFILVPPGPRGVGDRTGGWDEKSPGFDEREEAA